MRLEDSSDIGLANEPTLGIGKKKGVSESARAIQHSPGRADRWGARRGEQQNQADDATAAVTPGDSWATRPTGRRTPGWFSDYAGQRGMTKASLRAFPVPPVSSQWAKKIDQVNPMTRTTPAATSSQKSTGDSPARVGKDLASGFLAASVPCSATTLLLITSFGRLPQDTMPLTSVLRFQP